MNKSKFIAIRNQADGNILELYFLDVISDSYDFWTDQVYSKVQEIIDKVNYFNPSKIKLIIDSVGGDAQVGMTVYNFLKNCNLKVEVEIIGLAGSIASVVAMAANKGKLTIARNAFMMIHKAEGFGAGTSDESRSYADLVEKYTNQIVDIYSQRTGKTVDEINALMANGDYWMTGEEAVAQGFADLVFNDTPNLQVAARLKGSDYKNIPAGIKAQMDKDPADNPQHFFTKQIDDMKKFFTDIVNAIKNVKPTAAGDNATITNQIAEAISQPFDKLADEIETTINNSVDAAIKKEEFVVVLNAAVKVQVDNATKGLNYKITALETANGELKLRNEELVQDIATGKGGASGGATNKDGGKTIGSFKK